LVRVFELDSIEINATNVSHGLIYLNPFEFQVIVVVLRRKSSEGSVVRNVWISYLLGRNTSKDVLRPGYRRPKTSRVGLRGCV
jgi:hypothetical protein